MGGFGGGFGGVFGLGRGEGAGLSDGAISSFSSDRARQPPSSAIGEQRGSGRRR